jgi:hypothetical protein
VNLGCGRWKTAPTMVALSAAMLPFGARTLRADDCGNLGGPFMDAAGVSQGGNRADNIGLPKASAPAKCASFPTVGPCE